MESSKFTFTKGYTTCEGIHCIGVILDDHLVGMLKGSDNVYKLKFAISHACKKGNPFYWRSENIKFPSIEAAKKYVNNNQDMILSYGLYYLEEKEKPAKLENQAFAAAWNNYLYHSNPLQENI